MKFWIKLMLSIIVIIAIILSCSRFIIVKQNFIHSIENTANQYTNQHVLEGYYLESNIINNIQLGEEVTSEKIIDNIKSLYSYMENNSDMVALYTESGEKIFTNFEQIDNIKVKELFDKEVDNYCLNQIGENYYMIFSSYLSINNEVIYIINIYDITSIYQERDRQIQEIRKADLILLIISSVFISVFSIFLTKPIKKLNETSKKIASGNFKERANIQSKDEIGELAKSFNLMAEQIENKISTLNLVIKQKDDFINGFTHEIKTPMTAIVGYSDLLRLKKCNEELTMKALNYIYFEAKRLEELSYKLMSLMSLSENTIELENIKTKEFINKISNKIISDKIQIKVEVEPAVIKGDKSLIEVVIRNLIENSKKANPKDNIILIKGELLNNKYRILIIDKGKGIPKEHIERVTEDFYMVDKSRSRINGGSGIGLSLCKKILEKHNSEIKIESEENIGTTVYFDLEVAINEN